jgi:hypothetical protein
MATTLPRPHLTCTDGGSSMQAYYLDRAGMLFLFEGAHYSQALAEFCSRQAYPKLLERYPGESRYTCIHDWRSVKSYDKGARVEYFDWGRRVARTARVVLCIPEGLPALVNMGVSAGVAILANAGVDIRTAKEPCAEIVSSLGLTIARL